MRVRTLSESLALSSFNSLPVDHIRVLRYRIRRCGYMSSSENSAIGAQAMPVFLVRFPLRCNRYVIVGSSFDLSSFIWVIWADDCVKNLSIGTIWINRHLLQPIIYSMSYRIVNINQYYVASWMDMRPRQSFNSGIIIWLKICTSFQGNNITRKSVNSSAT